MRGARRTTNNASSTTPSAPTITICAEPHAQVVPPRLATSTIALSAEASSAGPEVVDRPAAPRPCVAGSVPPSTASATMPERQVDVEDPAPRDRLARSRPRAAARRRWRRRRRRRTGPGSGRARAGQTTSPMTAWVSTISPPAPRPWTARKAISSVMSAGQAAQRRADQEQHDRALQHALAPVQIAELAVDRRHRGLREQERARHPGEAVEAAEVADDRRQRRRDDRLIERRQQHHQHQPAKIKRRRAGGTVVVIAESVT